MAKQPTYPFNPDLLDVLPEELAELFRDLELTLVEEICSRLKIADDLNEVTLQDIRALRSHGITLKEVERAIRQTTGISRKKLNELMDKVVKRNEEYYGDLMDFAQLTKPDQLVSAADIDAIRRQTMGVFRNMTASMGFLVNGGRTMLPPAKAYQWALDSALLRVESGTMSYRKAIDMAITELTNSGIRTPVNAEGERLVEYESKTGRKTFNRLDVAVRRAVLTGVNQINQQYRAQSMEFLDTEYVQVTAHSGARDVDGPKGWENHRKWQGKIYRWNREKDK